jgi:hypothetical protein
MHIKYVPVASVDLLHSYHADGKAHGDFVAAPLPDATRSLRGLGMVFRPSPTGFALYAEVIPDSDPPRLVRSTGTAPIRLAFSLRAANAHVTNYTKLVSYQPGQTVLSFDNVGGQMTVGPAIDLETGGVLVHRFGAPVTDAVVTVEDRFGSIEHTVTVAAPAGSQITEHRIDLDRIDITPGRHVLRDDAGTPARTFFWDPDLWGVGSIGVIELFAVTPEVPVPNRFLDGDVVTAKEFAIAFAARATTWRYLITNRHGQDGIDLNQVEVAPLAFDRVVAGDEAVFTSQAKIPLAAKPTPMTLQHAGEELRSLPAPGPATVMAQGADSADLVSAMYVYI